MSSGQCLVPLVVRVKNDTPTPVTDTLYITSVTSEDVNVGSFHSKQKENESVMFSMNAGKGPIPIETQNVGT